jgi:hypothetical protein
VTLVDVATLSLACSKRDLPLSPACSIESAIAARETRCSVGAYEGTRMTTHVCAQVEGLLSGKTAEAVACGGLHILALVSEGKLCSACHNLVYEIVSS